MKTTSLSLVLALALGLTMFLPGSSARAAPSPAAQTKQDYADCLARCYADLQSNLKKAKKPCWICSFSLLGACLAGHHNEDCVSKLQDEAWEVHDACVDACPTPAPPPPPNPSGDTGGSGSTGG